MRAGDHKATPLPTPPRGWTPRTWPCEYCGNCLCPCVTSREDVELLLAEGRKRHKKATEAADLTDFLAERRARLAS